MGGNTFVTEDQGDGTKLVALTIDEIPLIGFSLINDRVFLNLMVFDTSNDLILHIDENELIYSISPWDIEFVANTLTIREAKRKILVQISFNPPDKVTIMHGRFRLNGVEVLVSLDSVVIANNSTSFSGCHISGATHGLVIGESSNLRKGYSRIAINYPVNDHDRII